MIGVKTFILWNIYLYLWSLFAYVGIKCIIIIIFLKKSIFREILSCLYWRDKTILRKGPSFVRLENRCCRRERSTAAYLRFVIAVAKNRLILMKFRKKGSFNGDAFFDVWLTLTVVDASHAPLLGPDDHPTRRRTQSSRVRSRFSPTTMRVPLGRVLLRVAYGDCCRHHRPLAAAYTSDRFQHSALDALHLPRDDGSAERDRRRSGRRGCQSLAAWAALVTCCGVMLVVAADLIADTHPTGRFADEFRPFSAGLHHVHLPLDVWRSRWLRSRPDLKRCYRGVATVYFCYVVIVHRYENITLGR